MLGIVDASKRATTPMLLDMTPQGNYSGWGFAVPAEGEERQAYVWDGAPIPRTVMEVAVTARKLRAQETAHLLK